MIFAETNILAGFRIRIFCQSYANSVPQSRQTTYVSPGLPFLPSEVNGNVVFRCLQPNKAFTRAVHIRNPSVLSYPEDSSLKVTGRFVLDRRHQKSVQREPGRKSHA